MPIKIFLDDCVHFLDVLSPSTVPTTPQKWHMTFLDPPFNQGKEYNSHDDNMDDTEYWSWIWRVCARLTGKTVPGGALYFMHREKNLAKIMQAVESTGWTIQNVIMWKKKSSAVPGAFRYGKSYQPIVYATLGDKPRTFNKLRIDPPLLVTEAYKRKNGVYLTDIWDDIREMTSGFYAGEEAIRDPKTKKRVHKQQSPLRLLARMILTSTMPGDIVFDPFAGTGTTGIAAEWLDRQSIVVEKDMANTDVISDRIMSQCDDKHLSGLDYEYRYTEYLKDIYPKANNMVQPQKYQRAFEMRTFE